MEITIPKMQSRKHYAIKKVISKQIGDTILIIICLFLTLTSGVLLILNAIADNPASSFKAVTVILPVALVTLFYALLKLTLSYADLEDDNLIFKNYASLLVICIEEQSDFKVKNIKVSDDSVYRWNVEFRNGKSAFGIIDNDRNRLHLNLTDDKKVL